MNKPFLLLGGLLLLFSSSVCWGQSSISFKEIPLGSTIDFFDRQLKQKGFKYSSGSSGLYTYEGPFFPDEGYEYSSIVSLFTTPYTNKVEYISVIIPSHLGISPWTSEEGRFKMFIDLFVQKYGEAKIYFIAEEYRSMQNPLKREVPYSKISYIDKYTAGQYLLEWDIGNNCHIKLSLQVEPQFITTTRKKKALGVIPYGNEVVEIYSRTTYSISISYKDSSIGRSSSPKRIEDI